MKIRVFIGIIFNLLIASLNISYGVHFNKIPICTEIHSQINPSVSGPIIVWQDNRNGNWDIYAYDLQTMTEYPICTAAGSQINPSVNYGDIFAPPMIVWQDNRRGNWDIYGFKFDRDMYSLTRGTEIVICDAQNDQINPDAGRYVCWQDFRDGNWDIYAYNFDNQSEFEVCTDTSSQINPAIYYSGVVWQDDRNGNWDIYTKNFDDNILRAICKEQGNQTKPDTYTGYEFAWEDDRNGNKDIYGSYCPHEICFDFNDFTIVSIASNPSIQEKPVRFEGYSQGLTFWQDYRNGNWDIYGFLNQYPHPPVEIPVEISGSNQMEIASDYEKLVWQDDRNGNWDIYMAYVCLGGNDSIGGCIIQLQDGIAYNGTTDRMGPTYINNEQLNSSCGYEDYIDAWHYYQPAVGGPITITTDGSQFDTTLSVYNASFGAENIYQDPYQYPSETPTELACNDDYCLENTDSKITMNVVKGKKYYIRVSGFDKQTGEYTILLTRGANTAPIASDLNHNGKVDFEDFAIFASEWLMHN
jgi:beta propeller repeat protein